MFRHAAALALALSLIAPAPSRAQATDQGADEIMAALTDWLSSISGERFTKAQIAADISIRPQDDHYVASLPLGAEPDAPVLTADISEALGRWIIDDISLPDDAVFNKQPGGHRVDLEIGGQSSVIFLDNTFSTATLGDATVTGVVLRSQNALLKADRILNSTIIRPLFDRHADVALDTLVEAFSLLVDRPATSPVKVDFAGLRTSLAFNGVTRTGMAKLMQALANKGNAQRAAAARMPPGDLADAFAGFTSSMTIGSRFDGLAWDDGELAGSVRSGQVVFAAAQQNGLVSGALDLDADTLALASAKLGPFAELIPKRFSLRETFANLPVTALVHLNALSDTGTEPAPEDIQQLFAQGGIELVLNEFLLDIGGASFTATGQSVMTAPRDIVVTGTVTATGLDALQQRLLANPVLAKGAPLLIFLKGAGRTVDDRVIWDIAYRDRQLTVNGQNLTTMMQAFSGSHTP